jgi:hypothetical protein
LTITGSLLSRVAAIHFHCARHLLQPQPAPDGHP